MLKKVALYDFDNTIASGDTIVRVFKDPVEPYTKLWVSLESIYSLLDSKSNIKGMPPKYPVDFFPENDRVFKSK